MAQPTIGWDYGLANKGTVAGQQAAAQQSKNDAYNRAQNDRRLEKQALEVKNQKLAAESQDQAARSLYNKTYDTFYKPVEETNYDAVNTMWDTTTNRLVDAFYSVQMDKDLSPRDQAFQANKLMRQIPQMAAGRKVMDERIAAFQKASAIGNVSGAMEAKYQSMYGDLADNKFDGGIQLVEDQLRLIGKTSNGEEIDLALEEFDQHMPVTIEAGPSLVDSMDGLLDGWKQKEQKFKETGKDIDKPNWDIDAVKSAMEKTVELLGADGPKVFAVDTLGKDPGEFDKEVQALMSTEQTVYGGGISEEMFESMTTDEQALYKPRQVKLTQIDAELQVFDKMLDQYANTIKTQAWDKSGLEGMQGPRNTAYDVLVADTNNLTNDIQNGNFDNMLDGTVGEGKYFGAKMKVGKDGKTPILEYTAVTQNFIESEPILDKDGNPETYANGKIKMQKVPKEVTKKRFVDFSDPGDVERFYKNKLYKNSKAAGSVDKVDKLWLKIKDDVFESIKNMEPSTENTSWTKSRKDYNTVNSSNPVEARRQKELAKDRQLQEDYSSEFGFNN